MALTGLVGGLASSTAVTLSFAKQGRDNPQMANALACGILLAWAVMFVRVLVLVAVVNRALAYARGRAVGKTDNAMVAWLHEKFESDGFRLRGLLESIATSEAFYAVSAPKADPGTTPPAKTPALDGAATPENRS